MALSKELLDILVCPKCRGDLTPKKDGSGLICEPCAIVYEIRDNIPIMLVDEAKPWDGKK